MDLASLIPLALKASIFVTVFCLGLNATLEDALYLLRRPSELLRSLVSMNVIMPVVAVALALAFNFHRAVEIALFAFAVSPIPPVFPKKGFKAGGRSPYVIGLLVAVSLLSIIIVPIAVDLVGRVFGRHTYMAPAAVAQLIFTTVLLPLAAGMAVRHFAPAFADKIAKPLALAATIILVAGALPILFVAWPAISSLIGNGTIIAIAVFVVIGLAVGHLLGGPDPDDRTVLALSTATRHPGVALGIASANAPGNKLVFAAVLLYLIVNAIVMIPYLNWRKRHHAGVGGTVEI